jgi:hypothetical protein
MKPAGNNEIDLLLRRLGGWRGEEESVAEESQAEPQPHLDADELSAYAENALPAAARARYTEHVADCARCRKIVTQLAMSAGVALSAAAPVSEKSGLNRFFANLFSPSVLRYAVPSLAAAVILGIGLMMFRYNAKQSFVAMQERVAAPAVDEPPTAASSAPHEETESQRAKSLKGQIANDSVSPSNGGSAALRAEEHKAPAQTADKNAKAAEEGSRADAAPTKELQARVVNNETATVGGAVTAPKLATSNSEPEEKRDVAKLKKEVETADQPVASNKDEDRQRKTGDASAARGASKPQVAGSNDNFSRLTPGVAGRRPQENKAPEDTEVRTVAGHRFHKEGAAWIDTAYDSSVSPINVARGSEQFRALVADEPAIRTIAEQLDGEVIVVWKSRTYRIH